MTDFSGGQLKQIRESKHISLEQVAKATRIQLKILRDLEDEEYSELASPTQVRGFLRVIAEYLGAGSDEIIEQPTSPNSAETLPTVNIEEANQLKPLSSKTSRKTTSSKTTKPKKSQPSVVNSTPRSQQILTDIGTELSARRRYLNLPWETIIEQTHIQKSQLQALEHGQLEDLMNPMEARSLLLTYAKFLNLDVSMLSLRFADALQERRAENTKTPAKKRKHASTTSPFVVAIKRFFTLDLFFGSMLVIGILGFLIWGMARMANQPDTDMESTQVPAMIDVLLTTPTDSPTTEISATVEQDLTNSVPTITPMYTPLDSDAAIQLVVIAHQNVWIRVFADDEQIFTGRLTSGTATSFTAEELIEVETGNASALEFVLNGNPESHSSVAGTTSRFSFDPFGMSVSEIQPHPNLTTTPTR